MKETNGRIYQSKTVKQMTQQELIDRLKQAGFDYQGVVQPVNGRGKPLYAVISNRRTYELPTRAMYNEWMALLEIVNFIENNKDSIHKALSGLELK